MDVQKGIEEFQQAEKDLRGVVNGVDSGEAQLAQGFDLADFLESSSMYSFIISLSRFFTNGCISERIRLCWH